MRRFLAVLALLLCLNPLLACNPEPGPNHFPPPPQLDIPVGYFELFNTLTGLPCNNIRSLLALDTIVFAGTEGEGLLTFTGGEWRQYTPTSQPPFPAPTVSCILKESDEVILAGTPNGIVRITQFTDDKGIKFELQVPRGPLGPDVLSLSKSNGAGSILAGTFYGAGTLVAQSLVPFRLLEDMSPTGFDAIKSVGMKNWFGSSDGLLELQGTSLNLKTFPPNDFGWVQALESDGKNLYIGAAKGLFSLNDNSCREVVPTVWCTSLFLTPGVADVFQGFSSQGLELASMSQGVKDTQAFQKAQKILNEMNDRYQTIMNAWNAGTMLEGAYNAYLGDLGKLDNKINASLMRGLWVGTQDVGVLLFTTDGQRRHLSKDNSKLPSNRVTAISGLESGETWIGTFDGGILRYRSYRLKVKGEPDPVFQGKASTIKVVGENLYVGTPGDGLYVFNVRTLTQLNHISKENREHFHTRVDSLANDPQGNLWVAGDSGLWRIGPNGLKQFGLADGLPASETVKVIADLDGRVFVAGKVPARPISCHIAGYNGDGFTTYSVENLKRILALPGVDQETALRTMGFLDTYQQSFDVKNASQALALYDSSAGEDQVADMLGTSKYLLIGTTGGIQYVFDGAAFKPLNIVGPGSINNIVAYGRSSNGTIVTMSPQHITTFNGGTFSPVFDVASPTITRYTDLTMDDMNPDLFWSAFETSGGGGFALYQHPKWEAVAWHDVIKGIARSFPYMFTLTPDGVYRFQL